MKAKNNGFTLVELLVVTVAGSILIAATVSLFIEYRKIHFREKKARNTEAELTFALQKMGQTLTTLPGRGLGCSNGISYHSATVLPIIGTVTTAKASLPINVGFVTPFKFYRNDAISVFTKSSDSMRLTIKDTTSASGSTGTAIATSADLANRTSINTTNSLPKPGELYCIVGSAPINQVRPGNQNNPETPAQMRLIKILSCNTRSISLPSRTQQQIVEISYELLQNSAGTQLPGLTNTSNLSIFGSGSIIVKPTFVSFFLSRDKQLIRNDGGVPTYDTDIESINIIGGTNLTIADVDSMAISYRTTDAIQHDSLDVPVNASGFLNKIATITVTMNKLLPQGSGKNPENIVMANSFVVAVQTIE